MNTIEFTQDVPVERVAMVFKEWFEQHMLTYDMLRGVQFYKLNNISVDHASLIYSIHLLDEEDKNKVLEMLNSRCASPVIYGRQYTPNVYMNGDLLCISFTREINCQ